MKRDIDPARYALFLDLDGTLLDIHSTPRDVVVPPGLIATLRALVDIFNGAVAIVTGRQVGDADRLLSPLKLATAGVHGVEIRSTPGAIVTSVAARFPPELLRQIQVLAERFEGVDVEPKGAAVSVHYRRAPMMRDAAETALRELLSGRGQRLELSHGRMVFEIKPRGFSKGEALELLLEQDSFRGRLPIMIGDDVPDVDALEVAKARGGLGLSVAGEYFSSSAADFSGPDEVREWLFELSEQARR